MSSDKPPSLVLLHLVTPHGARLAESLSRVAAKLPGLGNDAGSITLDFSRKNGLLVHFLPTRYSATCRGRLHVTPNAFTRFDFTMPGVIDHTCVVRAVDFMKLGALGVTGSSAVLSFEVESDGIELSVHGGTLSGSLRLHLNTIDDAAAADTEDPPEIPGVYLPAGQCPKLCTLLQKASGVGGLLVRLAAGADRVSLVCQVTVVSPQERARLIATLPTPLLAVRGAAVEPVFRLEVLLAFALLLAAGDRLALHFDADRLRLDHDDAPFHTQVWVTCLEEEDSPMDAF